LIGHLSKKSLIIAVNTRLLLKGKLEGIGWFSYEVLHRITVAHPEHQFVFIFDRPFDPSFVFSTNVKAVVVSPPARHPLLYRIWFNYRLPAVLKKMGADVFFSPDGFLSLRTSVPQIPVIHDINFEHFPEDLPKSAGKYYRTYFRQFAHRAAHIITVSEYSKQDIITTYNVPEAKVSVAHNGVNPKFEPLSPEDKQDAQNQFAQGCPYFVYVGALHRRKNITRLLQAFDIFKSSKAGSNYKLVIAGATMFRDKDMEMVYHQMSHKSSVVFLGRVEMDKLIKVMGGADALVYVSYFEGFGIPIVEAMRCGVPVITSTTTSMPEVAGDAALIINPLIVDQISTAMQQVTESSVADELRRKGLIRSELFKWDTTAAKVWEVIQNVVNEKTTSTPSSPQ
jgi:glycosyltransferase involved in cell wall biosynthesis